MTRVPGPTSVAVRRVALGLVLATSITATVVARHDGDTLLAVWIAFLLYLACCVEPMRRVRKTAAVSWALTAVLATVAVLCVGVMLCVPVVNYGAARGASASVLSLAAGVDRLSAGAQATYYDVMWVLLALLVAATLTLWYSVLRLMRRSEWDALDHATGDGGFRSRVEQERRPGDRGVSR